jgi:hypothetical protein
VLGRAGFVRRGQLPSGFDLWVRTAGASVGDDDGRSEQ